MNSETILSFENLKYSELLDKLNFDFSPARETKYSKEIFTSMAQTFSDIILLENIGTYKLAYKLMVEIIKEDDVYIAKSDWLNVWGDGETIEEATKSLENFILYDYNSYNNQPEDKLDFHARRDLNRYKNLFQVI